MNGFLTDDFIRTGRAGMIIVIGKGEGLGASTIINLDRNNRDRNSDIKGNSNINRGLRFSNISNRYNGNKNPPRFGNPKVNNKDNLRLSSHNSNSNNINRRFSNPRDSSNPNNSILNPKASNTREDQNTHSLKKNLKGGSQSIESKVTRSLKTLPSIISAGQNKRTIIVNIPDYFGMKSSRRHSTNGHHPNLSGFGLYWKR
jgi:hypothetical protein